jgi:hypothetical protein
MSTLHAKGSGKQGASYHEFRAGNVTFFMEQMQTPAHEHHFPSVITPTKSGLWKTKGTAPSWRRP